MKETAGPNVSEAKTQWLKENYMMSDSSETQSVDDDNISILFRNFRIIVLFVF